MNALEKLVATPHAKLFEEMELEVVNYMEAKTGSKLMISKDFSWSAAFDAAPMDVGSLVRAVNCNLASLVKGKKGGGKNGKAKFCNNCRKKGHKKKDCWYKPQQNGKGGGAKKRATARAPARASLMAFATIVARKDI